MKIKISLTSIICLWLLSSQAQTVKDIDGNIYKTLIAGNQVWMAENLRTTRLNDGTEIPLATSEGNEWANNTVSASTSTLFSWPWDSSSVYKASYGAFYNGYVIKSGKICPKGWHVPTDAEWTSLTTYLGGENVAGGKMKAKGGKYWQTPNNDATNEIEFDARAGGSITDNGSNLDFRFNSCWWSSTSDKSQYLWVRIINLNAGMIIRSASTLHTGNQVRCLKDVTAPTGKSTSSKKK